MAAVASVCSVNAMPAQTPAIGRFGLWTLRFVTTAKRTRAFQALRLALEIAHAATRRFLADDCLMRANSIAYSVVFSIIPFLAVLVRYADVDKDMIRTYLARFMVAYGMSDSTEFLIFLNEILDRASAIATIGAVIMIVSATNLLSYLEDSFNYIYRATSSRPLLYRFSIFVTSLVLLPAALILSGGILRPIVAKLQAPDLLNMSAGNEAVWISGTDGLLRVYREGRVSKLDLRPKVVPNADFREIVFDVETGRSGLYHELVKKPDPGIRLESADLDGIRRVAACGDRVYALSESGALFFSHDRGRSWEYRLLRFVEPELRQAFMEDIHASPNGRLLILATLGSRSLLLAGTVESGFQLRGLGGVFHRIVAIPPEGQANPAGGAADEKPVERGPVPRPLPGVTPDLYLTGQGVFLHSSDSGASWTATETRYGQRKLQIEAIARHPQGGFILGGRSALWRQGPAATLHANLRGSGSFGITGIQWEADGSGFVYGSDEMFRYTPDNGATWLQPAGSLVRGASLTGHLRLIDGTFLFIGERETIAHLKPVQVLKTFDSQGHPYFRMDPIKIQSYPFLKSLILQIVLFLIFSLIVLAIFVFGYRILPNAPVAWRPALIGGSLTAAALVLFILGFRLWIVTFSSTTVLIYGVWAVVPVGMLLILVSTQIILFGLELAFVIQHPYLYRSHIKLKQGTEPRDYLYWNCLLMTTLVYWAMYREKRPLTNARALPHFENDLATLVETRKRLVEHKLFAYDSGLEEYYPSRPPTEIRVTDIELIALTDVIDIPPHARSGPFGRRFAAISKKLHERLRRADGKMTIADMLTLFDHRNTRR